MVEVENLLTLESVDDIKISDDIALGVLRSLVDHVVLELCHQCPRLVLPSPLLADHASFRIERVLVA